jgi:hypothetical protein
MVTMLHKVGARKPYVVKDAVCWKNIRKYAAGACRSRERRHVLGLALMAQEAECEAMVFVRDQDGDKKRESDIEDAIDEIPKVIGDIKSAGGVAIHSIDAWCLAFLGQEKTELLNRPKEKLKASGIESTVERVGCVRQARLKDVADDAKSLKRWLERARCLLQ